MSVADAPSVPPAQPNLIREFDDVFQGEGLLQEKLHLEVDNTVDPVVLPVRKVPFALKEPLKREIDRLVAKGILVPVEVPTDWVSSMVVASKRNGKIRLCIDPKPLNKALKRNRYPLPTIDDLLAKLTNAKVFTVADAKNGFWHVPLDDESSYLTTFGTPWSRYRWTRMPFGISPAPEEFQRRLDNALQGLDGVMPIFDDILIFGAGDTEAEAMADHDAKLRALMQRCREKGIKLNKEKLKLRCKEVPFMGHMVLADTLSRAYKVPQPGESAAEATRGETEKDVESINMTQYIPMSEETQTRMQRATEEDEDLRDLKTVIRHGWPLRKDVPVKVRDYFPFRDELTMQNGLIFKGERLVVPTSLREEMTEKLRSSHIGIQGCLRRARETLAWHEQESRRLHSQVQHLQQLPVRAA